MKNLEGFESVVVAVGQASKISTESPPFETALAGELYAGVVSPGDRVKHDLWGSGTVKSARGVGALVDFDYLGHGVYVSASALESYV